MSKFVDQGKQSKIYTKETGKRKVRVKKRLRKNIKKRHKKKFRRDRNR